MPDDASLDDFVGGSEDATDGAVPPETDELDGTAESEDAESDEPAVDRAAATAAWTPEGEACADCGTAASFRWRDGEAMVCDECKEW